MTATEIRERLRLNLDRVQQLVDLHNTVESKGGPTKTDVLRAAVVFLHATLEDVVRSVLELRLPDAPPEQLGMLRFGIGDKKKEKISMSELAKHRGKSIDELIGQRIDAYLERSNFNNVQDLVGALEQSALEASLLDPHKTDLAAMTSRRHLIVHRADRNPSAGGPGHKRTRSIGATTVTTWKSAVEAFCCSILDKLDES